MPNMCELDALLAGGTSGLGNAGPLSAKLIKAAKISDLRDALSEGTKKKSRTKKSKAKPKAKSKAKSKAKTRKLPPGPSAKRMLEIAEAQYAKGQKNLALAWGARAIKRAEAEGEMEVKQKAEELVKMIRGQEVLKALSGLGDVDGLVMGRLAGLW